MVIVAIINGIIVIITHDFAADQVLDSHEIVSLYVLFYISSLISSFDVIFIGEGVAVGHRTSLNQKIQYLVTFPTISFVPVAQALSSTAEASWEIIWITIIL